MTRGDYHMHTTFCDGKSTPEEMVLSALEQGLPRIGFSIHTDCFDQLMFQPRPAEKMAAYRAEITRLKEAYRDRLEILCGAECDYFFPVDKKDYDYLLCSVHYLQTPDGLVPIDMSRDVLSNTVNTYYDGDYYRAAGEYFSTVARLGERCPDVIGHFDLIMKYNEGDVLFDSQDPRYLSAAYAAVDALLPLGVPFEINTGALSRGYRTAPYPAEPILHYILAHGGKVVLNSDAHAAQNVAFGFDRFENLVQEDGWYDDRCIGKNG